MTGGLEVRFADRRVGRLRLDPTDRLCFQYDARWLAAADRFAISRSLPLSEAEEVSGRAHAFFANLLPEGAVRQAVCRRLGISEGNDAALLRAIGGECAGALRIVAPDAPLAEAEPAYEELSPSRLQQLVEGDGAVVPLLVGGTQNRLSLAGAQDKLPVALLDGVLHLPLDGAPSTHILKLPNPRYPHLPENEAFVLGLARRAGLDVVAVDLTQATAPASLLLERYDRVRGDDPWPARRLHQEDLCQALGLPASRKYEAEGGPSLADALSVVRDTVGAPLRDVPRLIAWQVFNAAAGNSDGHGKNLAFVRDEGGARLAPFYDLVATRAYPGIDRRLAMGIGGRHVAEEVGRAQWQALARAVEIRERVMLDLVEATLTRIVDALPAWVAEFRATAQDVALLQALPRQITRRVRRLLRALA